MHYKPHRRSRRRPLDFILPFLIIICVGVVAVLAFQLYFALTEEPAENKVNVHIAAGKARFLPWGMNKWQNVYSGMNLLPGDALRTSKEGRTVLEFFNGSVVRVAPNSEMILQEIQCENELDRILLALNNGEVWVNEKADIGKLTDFSVRTKNLVIKSMGTIFDVVNDGAESVRVMSGKVSVSIFAYEEGEERGIDTIEAGIGQEVVISSKEIDAFKARKAPSVLAAISDKFEDSNWYKWNTAEDLKPTDFSVKAEVEEPEESEKISVKPLEVPEEDEFEDTEPPNPPVITEPKEGEREIEVGPIAISGTAGPDTEKIIIETDSEKYTLSKYVPGGAAWKYVVSEAYGNLKTGENKYSVYAVDKTGNKSMPAEIVIILSKPTQEELGSFTAPLVISYNGSLSNEVSKSPVVVKGQVSGAVSVVVNDYILSQFKAGDTEWIYYLNEKYGNLLPGFNEYEVYAVNAEGEKSEVVKFQVIYKKEGVQSAVYTSEP